MAQDQRRLELQTLLESITPNVYFQPPANLTMEYPCIVFELNDVDTLFADNVPYRNIKRYQLTVIDENPDSDIPDKIANLPMCVFNRHFVADELNQNVFNIFF